MGWLTTWLVPFACVLAMPTIWIRRSALLLASPPLYRDRARWQTKPTEPATPAVPVLEVAT